MFFPGILDAPRLLFLAFLTILFADVNAYGSGPTQNTDANVAGTAATEGDQRAKAAGKGIASQLQKIDFAREVLPILSDKCFVCHGPDADQLGLLRLDSSDSATQDLGGYRAVDTEKPADSEILNRITSTEDPMPPEDAEKPVSAAEREVLERWIMQGGSYAKHWAFVPPVGVKATGQAVSEPGTDAGKESIREYRSSYSKDPRRVAKQIDDMIFRAMQEADVQFAPAADRAVLARRTALVLTGLLPEANQLQDFLQDGSADAFQVFVDRLMHDPRYGEHQARFWLDAVRYGDTHGLHLDNRRGIYAYRDWVVKTFNQNLAFDQFLIWQLAGDLLPAATLEQQVASGFVRMNPSTSEGGAIPDEFQAKNSFDRTESFGTVLLGLTLTCARCHTHKYDPITQQDYYQLLAFFNNTQEGPLDGNRYDYGPTVRAPQHQQAWQQWDELASKRANLISAVDQLIRKGQAAAPESWTSADRGHRLKLLANGDVLVKNDKFRRKATRMREQFETLESQFVTTLVAKEREKRRPTHLLLRGEYDKPSGDALEPAIPSVLGGFSEELPRNRLGLATWIVSDDNPLTARVLVNRIWQNVFGYGLVRTPEDFGLQGQQPTHPALLDHLAVEFQASGWDYRHILRSILLSRTYQQSSAWRSGHDDPQNRLLARGPSYRLDAEVIRDIGLWASGLLNPHMGGEGVKPYQPSGMWKALAHPASNTKQYERDEGDRLYRRSLYIYWKRTSPHPMMTLFDAPDRESSCVRRSRTSTSLQSLALLNETQRLEMARKFAERILIRDLNDSSRIDWIFELLACRRATESEQEACQALLDNQRMRFKGDRDDALQLLSIGDAHWDDSTDVEELAAWTQLAATVLASDIALMLY